MGNEQNVHRNRTVHLCAESMTLKRNNYEPLHFHQVHGDNIKLSMSKTVASRTEGFCDGIVFSHRPISVCERIYVKFLETSPNWSGGLRIGFTMHDPVFLKSVLPKYSCPNLISMQGNWAKAIAEVDCKKDSVHFYYVDLNGDVHYGTGTEEIGIVFGGVDTSHKLWAVLDVYGNTISVKFEDSTNQRRQNESLQNARCLQFHTIHGENVMLSKNRRIVSKKVGISSLGYAFTEHPLEIGRKITMSVQQTDHLCEGLLVYGITSCDPKNIDPRNLPENAEDLFDRPEYWIVKQKAYPFAIGDKITFGLDDEGRVQVSRNGEELDPVFYVDHTQPLWLFVKLTNSISQLCLGGASGDNSSFNNDGSSAMVGMAGEQPSNECVICYEEQVDCVLYRCGHMCMCYNCAFKLWESSSTAQCPMCRKSILDVIKTYK